MKAILSPLVAALVLAGCATVPPIDAASVPAAPAAFKEQASVSRTVSAPVAPGAWWKSFSDPVLDRLMARADERNAGIQVAASRLAQARAFVQTSRAAQMPQLGAIAGATRQDGLPSTKAGGALTLATAGAVASYEVDLFGRLAQATEAASLDARAREALLQGTRLVVQAEVAQTYFALRAIDAERSLVRATVMAYRDTLAVTESLHRAGDVAELDVARARAEVAATQADAIALDRRRAELEHSLAVLVGDVASEFSFAEAEWQAALPDIPAGVPSGVLTRRPDIAAAQSALRASQARVGVAKAAWFPEVSLTANGGYASSDVGELFKWSARAWGVGALLALPIFDGGRRQAGVDSALAEMDGALARYREQILVAFRDVEDQLAALRLLADQAQAQEQAVSATSRATHLSDARYRNGLVSQLELLDARRSELRSRREALQVRSARYQATVGLIRALGGGWEATS